MATTSDDRAVDYVRSWARRSGDRVHLVLRMPGLALEHGTRPAVQLIRGRTTATTDAEVTSTGDGTTLTADISADDLGTGTWKVALRLKGENKRRPLDARLLLPRRGPIALLTGPVPAHPLQPRARGGNLTERAVRTVGRASDAALRQLPPEQAVRYRRALRRLGRAVRG